MPFPMFPPCAGPGRGQDVGNPAASCQLALPALGDTSWVGAKAPPQPCNTSCWPPPGASRMLGPSVHAMHYTAQATLGPPLHLCSHQPPYKVNVATFWVAVATASNIEWPNRTDKNSQEVGAGNGVHRWGSMQAALGLSDLLLTTQLIPRSWRARATIFPSPPPSWALGGMEIIPPSCFPACAADCLQHCRLPTCLRRNRTKTSSAEAEGKEPALYFFKGYWRLE